MRRLEAIFSESRKSVSSSSRLGKTEKSTAFFTCTAERKTSTDAENEHASSRSKMIDGTGISMTKITLMAAIGNERSLLSFPRRSRKLPLFAFALGADDAGTTAVELITSPLYLQKFGLEWCSESWQPDAYPERPEKDLTLAPKPARAAPVPQNSGGASSPPPVCDRDMQGWPRPPNKDPRGWLALLQPNDIGSAPEAGFQRWALLPSEPQL